MKNAKRLTALILSLVLVLALAACGSSGDKGSTTPAGDSSTQTADNPYNLDYSSADLQAMTSDRASKDALIEAGDYYMHGLSSDSANFTKTTYKDMADHIGVDASEFQYFESWGQYRYTWYVEGSEGASLLAVFDTNGNLTSVTSSVS